MPNYSVSDVFDWLHSAAQGAGLPYQIDEHPESFGSRLARIVLPGAELQLVLDGADENLTLQLTHLPLAGIETGWIMLFSAPCPGGTLAEDEEPGTSFRRYVEDGVGLMVMWRRHHKPGTP